MNRAITLIREGAIGVPQTIIHDRRGFVQPSRIPSLGDVFEDLGVHDFDIMTRINQGPAKLYAQCISQAGVFNAGTVMVKFENDAEHIFHLSRQYAGRGRSMDVSGTKGTLALDFFGQIAKPLYVTEVEVPSRHDGGEFDVNVAGGQDHLKGKIFRINQMGLIPVYEMAWVINSVELALDKLGRRTYDGTANKVFNEIYFGMNK